MTTTLRPFILSCMLFFAVAATGRAQNLLIPMDFDQSDHLKAYGVAYHALSLGISVEWLLNYRAGSFLIADDQRIREYALVRGVTFTTVDAADIARIDEIINESNMSREPLEKCPKVAVYTPPGNLPWDDPAFRSLGFRDR